MMSGKKTHQRPCKSCAARIQAGVARGDPRFRNATPRPAEPGMDLCAACLQDLRREAPKAEQMRGAQRPDDSIAIAAARRSQAGADASLAASGARRSDAAEKVSCPECGAMAFRTDAQCMSCGASLVSDPELVASPPSQKPKAAGALPHRHDPPLQMAIDLGDETVTIAFPEHIDVPEPARSRIANYLMDTHRRTEIGAIAADLACILLGYPWTWSEYEMWRPRFQEMVYFPKQWAGMEDMPASSQAIQDQLECFRELSSSTRRALVLSGILTAKTRRALSPYEWGRKFQLHGDGLRGTIAELSSAGFAQTHVPLADALTQLKKVQLQQIAEALQVGTRGTKAQIAERLASGPDPTAVERLLPSEARQEHWTIGPIFSEQAIPYVEYELKRIRLLGWTVRNFPITLRRYRTALALPGFECVYVCQDACPVCQEYADQPVNSTRGSAGAIELPPFYPGCSCTVGQREAVGPPAAQAGQATGCAGSLFLVVALPIVGAALLLLGG